MFYGKFTLLGDGVLVNDTSDLEYAIQLGIDRKLQEFILAAKAVFKSTISYFCFESTSFMSWEKGLH